MTDAGPAAHHGPAADRRGPTATAAGDPAAVPAPGPAAADAGEPDAGAAAAALLAEVGRLGSVAVAYSGGVDSTVVLAAAVRALGPGRAVAVIADSPALARGELALARETAADLGAELVVLDTDELSVAGYRANAGDRCYFCKQTVLGRVSGYAAEHGFAHVATGTHLDDRRAAHRPGLRAAKELAAAEPLAAAGLGKAAVRAVARAWGLPVAEKPGMPCLASRIAVGITVSKDRLHLVERAEERVRETLDEHRVGARDVRVRLLKQGFRIELDAPAHREVAAAHGLGDTLLREVAAVGPLGEGSLAPYRTGAVSTAARAASRTVSSDGAPTR
ncbi:TIGR00268 family protein [Streptomyces sp. WAC 06738]|uniref:TIGR00268 family protein n=1 Tax=Streptomyces sp. WAC 06738 TaxID=2203210 RepID=UPI000F7026CD|nr:TIGR00268 family protein [Streptomyces sp. WAC 06738]AZM44909.1 TIGR00268 family protein [Streptomyces sp. WAC 06738]